MKTPPKAWVEKFVAAAALNTHAARANASIKVQQRLYERFMKLRSEAESKWPQVDVDTGMASAIEKWLREHPMRGPGVDW